MLRVHGQPAWEIQRADRPPAHNQGDLIHVALRLARIDQRSPRFAKILDTIHTATRTQVVVQAIHGQSLLQGLCRGGLSVQGWVAALREMLLALCELQSVGLSHGRIDSQSFRRQDQGSIVLDFFQPLAFAELPGESIHLLSLKSPERERSINFPVGIASDLFAVGRMAQVMLERCFDLNTTKLDPRLQLALRIATRLCAHDPEDRYAQPLSALHDLESLCIQHEQVHTVAIDMLGREALPRQAHLIGRQAQLYRLVQAWTRTQDGQADPISLVGPTGSGRSELLCYRHKELLLDGAFSIFLSPSAWGGSRRGFFDYLASSLVKRCEIRGQLPKLEALLKEKAQDLVAVCPPLQERFPQLCGPIPASAVGQGSKGHLLAQLLIGLGPMVILVDDADRCDALARELMRSLIEQSADQGVLWVCASLKPNTSWKLSGGPQLRSESHILSLPGLDKAMNEQIAREHLGTASLPKGLSAWLGLQDNEPAPPPIAGLDRAFSQGLLVRRKGAWQLLPCPPDSREQGLRGIVLGDMATGSSPSPARVFLLRAAALGPAVRLDPLLGILAPEGNGARWLEYSVRMGVVACYPDGAHRLAHHDYVPKLLDPLSAKRRRKLHNELFFALTRLQNPQRVANWIELCAEQGFWAELHPGQRQRLLLDAIARAVEQHDQEALLRWYERWTARTPEPLDRIEDHVTLAVAAQRLGDPIKAKSELEQAQEACTSDAERAYLSLKVARLELLCNDHDRSAHASDQGLAFLRRTSVNTSGKVQDTSRLRIQLLLTRSCAFATCAPFWRLAFSLVATWQAGVLRRSPHETLPFLGCVCFMLARFLPSSLALYALSRWLPLPAQASKAVLDLAPGQSPQLWRTATVSAIFCGQAPLTAQAFQRWRAETAIYEDGMVRRTMLIGMRFLYAITGAYACARDLLDQLSVEQAYRSKPGVPSILDCSRDNAKLALGESIAPRIPIAFAKAPRGSRTVLMATEIERLCHIGELSAARAVYQQLVTLEQASPLLVVPLSSQLARVSLGYALIDRMLTHAPVPAELAELARLQRSVGKRFAAGRTHYAVMGAYRHLFSGRLRVALGGLARAEKLALAQGVHLALFWIELGRALCEHRQAGRAERVSKLARGAIFYAEQMPCPRLRERVRQVFDQTLRSARALAQPGNPHAPPLPQVDPAPRSVDYSLGKRFANFRRKLAMSPDSGESLRAFLDAVLDATNAQRAAAFVVQEDASLLLLAARKPGDVELDTAFQYDQDTIQRAIESGQPQISNVGGQNSHGIRSAMAATYRDERKQIGVLYLDDPECHYRFDEQDTAFLAGVLPQLPLRLELEHLKSTTKERGLRVHDLQARSEHLAKAFALSETKRQQLLTYAHDPVILVDAAQGAVLELSDSARSLLADARDQFSGAHFSQLFPSDRIHHQRERLREAIEVGHAQLEDEELETATGQKIPVNVHLRRVEFGDLTVVQATFEDLRERNHLQAQVQRAQKVETVGTLASGIAHDFNNMLGAIGTVAAAIDDQSDEGITPDKAKSVILETVERASRLTDQLFDLARKKPRRSQPVDLYAHVQSVFNLLQGSLGPDIKKNLQIPDDGTKIYIDQSELTQIILNLALNAREAMPNGGQLHVSCHTLVRQDPEWEQFEGLDSRPYCVLTFQDTGSGIPEELLPNIFQAFFTTKSKGTGLGLATVHELVTRSGGAVIVRSQVYRGTTFKVALPEYVERSASKPSLPRSNGASVETPHWVPHSNQEQRDVTLLYVEDDEAIRPMVHRALAKEGYRIHSFASSSAAKSWFEDGNHAIDLLLTDIHLPGMGGLELLSALRVRDPSLSALFLTGLSKALFMDDKERELFANTQLLQKPFTTKALLEAVARALITRHEDPTYMGTPTLHRATAVPPPAARVEGTRTIL